MRSSTRLFAALASLLAFAEWVAPAPAPAAKSSAMTPASTAAKSAPAKPAAPSAAPAIATVGDRKVSKDEFDQRNAFAMRQYRERSGVEVPPDLKAVIQRQVLESMIRHELLVLEAKRRGMSASDAAADAEVRKDPYFSPNGKFDEQRYAAIRAEHPQAYEAALQAVREQLAARDLEQKIQSELLPETAEARAEAALELTRARTAVLGLRVTDFNGTFVEPTESEMLAYYRAHAEDFRRPDRAVLSFVAVPSEPADSLSAAAARAWSDRQRRTADSLLTALRGGADLSSAGNAFGGVREHVVVTRDNFPGFWKGEKRDRDAVFSTSPGRMLPNLVASDFGWLAVRVDDVRPSAIAPLSEVAREIRTRLRGDARAHSEERELRALYAQFRDSLAGPGYRVRFAVVDTGRMVIPPPTQDEVQKYYENHMADYSLFDSQTGAIRARPLAEVRPDIASRWQHEQRVLRSRALIEGIQRAWQQHKRDKSLEKQATSLREVGPLPVGAPVDTSGAASALRDSVWAQPGRMGVGIGEFGRGRFVYDVYEQVPKVTPTYEQAMPALRAKRDALRHEEAERGARAMYDLDPMQFAGGRQIHYTRIRVPAAKPMLVPLTRDEVERFYQAHIDRYTSPEQVRARHVLVAPADASAAADSAAHQRALQLLARARKGEDFAELARQYSDDEATKNDGGDLGDFGRGVMLLAFERVAFSLSPGSLSEPVRTEAGYELIKVISHDPVSGHPLATIYTNVGVEAARDKGNAAARRTADSLYRVCRTPATLRAAAKKMKLEIVPFHYSIGDWRMTRDMKPVLEKIQQLKVGEIYPGTFEVSGGGTCIAFVDSITPPKKPEWYQAANRAVDAYNAGAGRRAFEAKRVELDSLLHAGWSLDSLGTLWGGLSEYVHARGASGLPGLGAGSLLDSLLLGSTTRPAVLSTGDVSDWLEVPEGQFKLRYVERLEPSPAELSSRMENDRRTGFERKLFAWFNDLKRRYPVKILDPTLAAIPLPGPPEPKR